MDRKKKGSEIREWINTAVAIASLIVAILALIK